MTTLMLMLASRLPGQPLPNDYGQIVACNEGTISFSVAWAYRDFNLFSGYEWQFKGWYNVDPGKCNEIGPLRHYGSGGIFRKDPVALLAFAFYDSTGTWGAIRLGPYGDGLFKAPSNQQFCVQREGFGYVRDLPAGDLPRGDPVVEVPRGDDGPGPHQPALPQSAQLPGAGDQVKQRNVIGPGGRPGLGYRAGLPGDQQPAAVRRGHVPPARQRPDDVTGGRPGARRQGGRRPGAWRPGARRLAARGLAGADPQRPVHDGKGGCPAAPGGPAAPIPRTAVHSVPTGGSTRVAGSIGVPISAAAPPVTRWAAAGANTSRPSKVPRGAAGPRRAG